MSCCIFGPFQILQWTVPSSFSLSCAAAGFNRGLSPFSQPTTETLLWGNEQGNMGDLTHERMGGSPKHLRKQALTRDGT